MEHPLYFILDIKTIIKARVIWVSHDFRHCCYVRDADLGPRGANYQHIVKLITVFHVSYLRNVEIVIIDMDKTSVGPDIIARCLKCLFPGANLIYVAGDNHIILVSCSLRPFHFGPNFSQNVYIIKSEAGGFYAIRNNSDFRTTSNYLSRSRSPQIS